MIDTSEAHGPEFFEQMATRREPYRLLGQCIADALGVFGDVIDFGCGTGYVIERLQELGHTVIGVDPYGASVTVPIYPADLSEPLHGYAFDLVICTETGEHLPESAADTLVGTVTKAAERMIVWSAAPPGQDWPGHINMQPPAYWLAKFSARGWTVDAVRTAKLRELMLERHAQHEYCTGNFHVLVRDA